MTYTDPRGPQRKIVAVEEVHTPVQDGILYKVRVTLDCGCVHEPNPTFSYRVGDRDRCFRCPKKSKELTS